MSKKVLIVLLGAIGDVTRGLSLAVRLKRAWPDSHVTWAVEPISRPLVEGHPAIDRVVVFERSRGLRGYRDFIVQIQSSTYDITLDLQRHFKSGVTSYLSRANRRVGFHYRNAKELNWIFNNEHIGPVENFSAKIDHYHKFGDYLSLPSMGPLEFDLPSSGNADERISALLGRYQNGPDAEASFAALLLGSSWPSRFWSAEHYRRVIVDLHSRYKITSLLVGGAGEEHIANEILAGQETLPAINLVRQTTLSELPALFRRARFALGSDCGPMHIAAASGIPVISLWGSTSPKRSAPYGSEELVLQSTIGCSPCYRRRCPGLGTQCMRDIPPEAVLAQVERLFASAERVLKSADYPEARNEIL
ncbi:MAG: glycosyltransferase family 9 protein [Bdellovibrionota bacterium]